MNKAFLLHGKISCISCAVLVLTACGGGSGYSPPPPPPATKYTVGGMVSGLAGSGLVLDNTGEHLAISANGSFSFATKIAMGAPYEVTVFTSPTNPSQTCGITNAGGNMGSSNVANVLVACTTPNLANAKLTGTYKVVEFQEASPFDYGYMGDYSNLLTLTFDGAGHYSGTNVQSGDGSVGSSAVSGTYTVTTDGTLTITPTGEATDTGGLSADGNTLVASQITSGFYPSVLFGIKQGQTNFSNANLTGTYTTVRYDYNSAGDSSGLSTVTFDGVGNFSGTDTLNNAGTVTSSAISGTYAVTADGTLTISPTGGSTVTGGLSADGNTLVASQTTSGVLPEVLFGIKQGQTNFSSANLTGAYTAVSYRYSSAGDVGGLSTASFNGANSFDAPGVLNDAATVSTGGYGGTYTVTANGKLTLSTPNFTFTGGVSADGNTLVTAQVSEGSPSLHAPFFLVAIK